MIFMIIIVWELPFSGDRQLISGGNFPAKTCFSANMHNHIVTVYMRMRAAVSFYKILWECFLFLYRHLFTQKFNNTWIIHGFRSYPFTNGHENWQFRIKNGSFVVNGNSLKTCTHSTVPELQAECITQLFHILSSLMISHRVTWFRGYVRLALRVPKCNCVRNKPKFIQLLRQKSKMHLFSKFKMKIKTILIVLQSIFQLSHFRFLLLFLLLLSLAHTILSCNTLQCVLVRAFKVRSHIKNKINIEKVQRWRQWMQMKLCFVRWLLIQIVECIFDRTTETPMFFV